MGQLNYDDLRFLLAVAETGSTLSAARLLKVSQSTVSRRIAGLEQDLGVELFDKRRTGYELTDVGRSLIGPATVVRDAMTAFSNAMDAVSCDITGSVRFTTNDVLAARFLPLLISRLKATHPNISLHVVTTDSRLDLSRGDADIALRAAARPVEGGLVGVRITDDIWSLYCSRAYADRHGVPREVGELHRHSLISIDPHIKDHPAVLWVRKNFPENAIVVRQNTVSATLSSIRSGLGIGLFSEFVAAGDDDLIYCFRPEMPPAAEIWLITHERLRYTPRVRAVMDAAKALLLEYVSEGRRRAEREMV
ncbi:Transcriptional regulator, LysR family [Neorhizobium galegae bv. officinalis bv. officinalis str. HAMBI 1141]|uniref:Transcriptional regulator, LysR family n=1 Tax=Neorhizobium galegae bv. officinalis bv. officinalis str. HAMBI 1141 TaxID=1028801 RepID=A0A068T7B8_NEOGA|nr:MULTISPECIES: LysR family transcriptional regulator [Neorhizobium]MCJ9753355.1 LysR family transcriptional regulator [Neorhizobium sp. BETTINA12A]CDN54407.1 Transcriptional regulator, LysR family [Neorhizobium galegae bv. officinalis bv. officinalis str. HAMBI 1141]